MPLWPGPEYMGAGLMWKDPAGGGQDQQTEEQLKLNSEQAGEQLLPQRYRWGSTAPPKFRL